LRRQVERSREYAAQQGLDLDDTTTFHDIGVSAFRGKNLKQGALSRFLEAVQTKKIARGSYLLVESLDRFSRDEVINAHPEFVQLVRAGINVVTLIDQKVYRADRLDAMQLIFSLLTLARANDESKHKSDRLSKAWENKRANANERKLTSVCPAWLRLSADKTKFEVVAERAAIIRQMFEDSASGIGNYAIAKRLNGKGIPSFARVRLDGQLHRTQSTGWQISYIAKILNNPAVYGAFQPHKFDAAGKRIAHGPALANYYPTIVPEDLFLRAKRARHLRDFSDSTAPKGPKGHSYANLFSSLARCAYCGSSMWFENKGQGPKGGRFLVCDRVKRGLGCQNVRWRYDDFEASCLLFLQELDLEDLLIPNRQNDQIATTIQVLQGRLTVLREQQEKTFELHLQSPSEASFVARKLTGFDQQISEIEAEIAKAKAAQVAARNEANQFNHSKVEIKKLIDRLQNATDEETYKLRARVASALHSLVETIRVAGAGERHLFGFEEMNRAFPRPGVDQSDWRYLDVSLKDGSVRIVKPEMSDPLLPRAQYELKAYVVDDLEGLPSL
jgi:DNA invertase Pin-like site-specific DNA recombinase